MDEKSIHADFKTSVNEWKVIACNKSLYSLISGENVSNDVSSDDEKTSNNTCNCDCNKEKETT